MLEQCIITGFADEIDEDIRVQVKVLKEIGQSYIELRGANGKDISEHTMEEAAQLKSYLDEQGIKVSAIGSPIGKINIGDEFEGHFKLYQHVVELAKLFETKYIRIFSFFMEKDEAVLYKDEVFSRMKQFVEYAKEQNVILLHENEKDIYGDCYSRCAELMEAFYGEHFKCTFDFANFVQCGEDTRKAYESLGKYIHYIHIKDAILSDGEVVPPGHGDGHLDEILSSLDSIGYQGFLSLEPHLADFSGFQKLEKENAERKTLECIDAYKLAFQEFGKLLNYN